MSAAQIIDELPKLTPADLLAVRRKLIEISEENEGFALCDAAALEGAQLLDQMEAGDGERDCGEWEAGQFPPLALKARNLHLPPMTQKELVLDAISELPDDASLTEIADRVDFLAAIQKGFDQLDRGEGIPHEEMKRQIASWLTN